MKNSSRRSRIDSMRLGEYGKKLPRKEKYYSWIRENICCCTINCSDEYIAELVLELMELVIFTFFVSTGDIMYKCNIAKQLEVVADEKSLKAAELLNAMYDVRNNKAHMNIQLYSSVFNYKRIVKSYKTKEEFKDVMSLLYPDPDVPDCIYDIYEIIIGGQTDTYKECRNKVQNLLVKDNLTVGEVCRHISQEYNHILVSDCVVSDLDEYKIATNDKSDKALKASAPIGESFSLNSTVDELNELVKELRS